MSEVLDLKALRKQHVAWIEKEGTSRGQLDDSGTIVALIDRIETLETTMNDENMFARRFFEMEFTLGAIHGMTEKFGCTKARL
jgi:hypothetical protein